MSIVILALGVIIGLLINPVKQRVPLEPSKLEDLIKLKLGQTQFIDPISGVEKFKQAKDIGDLIDHV